MISLEGYGITLCYALLTNNSRMLCFQLHVLCLHYITFVHTGSQHHVQFVQYMHVGMHIITCLGCSYIACQSPHVHVCAHTYTMYILCTTKRYHVHVYICVPSSVYNINARGIASDPPPSILGTVLQACIIYLARAATVHYLNVCLVQKESCII